MNRSIYCSGVWGARFVWLCFFSDILLILFSCIAASLFNKLTYVLYDSTGSLTPERYLDPIIRFCTTRARGRTDLGTCDVYRNRPRLCVHVNQPDSVQSDLGRKNALPLERSPVGLHVCPLSGHSRPRSGHPLGTRLPGPKNLPQNIFVTVRTMEKF